jgi:hypothetical protein
VGRVWPRHWQRARAAQQVVRLHMNKLQRDMVINWCACGAVLLAVLILEAIGRDRWIQSLLVSVAVIAVLTRWPRQARTPTSSWATALANHRWVKWWMVAGAALSVGIAVLALKFNIRVIENTSVARLFALVAILVGPLFFLGERQRYRDAATNGAI